MDKQISKIKFVTYVLGLILAVQLVGTAFYFRNSNVLFAANNRNIDSMIGEIGQLKDENRILSQRLESQKDLLNLNESTLTDVFQKVDTQLTDNQQLKKDIDAYKTQLENQKKLMSNLLDQKNEEIAAVKNEKDLIARQTTADDKIMTILFLGSNQKLTDSIIMITIDTEQKKISLLSIPRDLYVNGRKINEFYEFYGPEKTKEIIKQVTGLTVDKYVSFNFAAFTDLIDYLGGININVDKKIVDENYPTDALGKKTVVFDPGLQKMDGEKALEYARSRKSTNDFDRSLRQQKIVLAIKSELDAVGTLDNILFYVEAFKKIQQNVSTDLNIFEAIQIYDSYKDYPIFAGNILSDDNFLYASKSTTGQFILLPRDGNFQDFQSKLLDII